MKITDALKHAKNRLDSANLANKLLCYHLKTSKEWIFLNQEAQLEDEQGFFDIVSRYENGEPFEYITGVCEFLDSEFYVGKGVLIPRFETEFLVQKSLEIAKKFDNPKICEIGVGSGIISISLALRLKKAKFVASDISDLALFWAKKNISKFDVDIELHHTSLLDGINGDFDILVSNPPYIKQDYKLDKWVLSEPREALFGGKNGDEILKDIINIAKNRAKFLLCEIGYDQKQSLSLELEKAGFSYAFYKDLAGFDRGFVAKNLNKS